jgi:hypothetical protein
LTYVLKRQNSNIKVWDSQTMGTALLDSGTEATITFSAATKTVWVENPSGSDADLELIARSGTTDICSDKVHFYPFASIVVVFGGNEQVPSDPVVDQGSAMFVIATNLYAKGYDVHMYNQNTVGGDGAGVPYDEVVGAIQHRNVNQVAIFGYSYGGDATHDLAGFLNANQASIGTFTLSFSAYVDAVERNGWLIPPPPSQRERPPGSAYHVNYYQMPHGGLFVVGEHALGGDTIIPNPPGANVEVNVRATWDPLVTHYFDPAGMSPPDRSIDNNANVMSGILSSFLSTVTPP